MEQLQAEIKAETNITKLAWTPRLLQLPAAIETILGNLEKRTVTIKITVTSMEDRDKITKNDIWFGSWRHHADHFTEISPNTQSATCCHWGYTTQQCPNMECIRCQLSSGPHTTKNQKCEVTICRDEDGRGCTHTIAKCANYRVSYYATSPICPVTKQVIILARIRKNE